MLDIFHLPKTLKGQTDIFTGNGNIQTWEKPDGISMVHITSIGAGGGGGSGPCLTPAVVNCAGGAGGGSGSIARLMIPATLLPDTLYMQIGLGGRGGAGVVSASGLNGGLGISGGVSALGVSINLAAGSKDLLFYQTTSNYGGYGYSAGADAGTGAAVVTSANSTLSNLGLFKFTAGQSAFASLTVANVQFLGLVDCFLSAGARGAGIYNSIPTAAGSVLGAGLMPTISGGATPSETGSSGIFMLPLSSGGGGGGGGGGGMAGNGGNGSYGSGGGGGGTSFLNQYSGAGGRGGDGIMIFSCW